MVEMEIVYQGNLHCELTHGPSKNKISTDAPVDNNGKGAAFSPTDLVGAALGSCILTTVAISANKDNIALEGVRMSVQKEMVTEPHRRIGRLLVESWWPSSLDSNMRRKFEHIATTCPVHRSLHPDVKIEMKFHYDEKT